MRFCFSSLAGRWRRGLAVTLVGAMLVLTFVLPSPVAAAPDRIDIVQFALDPYEDGWAVDAQFAFGLSPRLEDALEHALVPLYFDIEFELIRPRWYWFDDRMISERLTYRLSYEPLTRQYRIATGTLHVNFPSLPEALSYLYRVRDWKVIEQGTIHPGDTYVAALRMRLDINQLPKPFQLSTFTNHEWQLESDWKRFTFEVTR